MEAAPENAPEASLELSCAGHCATQAELAAFFQTHFSAEAIAAFEEFSQSMPTFQPPHEAEEVSEWPEDDLGYYDDGVKRTLTDEQIEFFRQSELRELRQKQDQELKRKSMSTNDQGVSSEDANDGDGHDGASSLATSSKRKRKRGAVRTRREPKPDLRKRTWDVVEPGLDTLDYD